MLLTFRFHPSINIIFAAKIKVSYLKEVLFSFKGSSYFYRQINLDREQMKKQKQV